MHRPRLRGGLFLLIALMAGATLAPYAQSRMGRAPQDGAQELYGAAKRHYDEGAYGKALEVIEDLLKTEPDFAPALLLKSRALLGLFVNNPQLSPYEANTPDIRRERKIRQAKLLKEAADSLERFLQLKPDAEGADWWRAQLDSLRAYSEPAIKPESEWTIFSPGEVAQKALILNKPPPRYPEEGRALGARGAVRLLAVFAVDGTIKHILILKSDHRVLTGPAVEAARGIKFEPAVKDGRPVATAILVEYNFSTY